MNRISISILSIICLVASANASSPYRAVIASVVDRNAELASQSAAISAEETNARAENTLEGPELEFEHLWASASSDIKWNAGITQEFSFRVCTAPAPAQPRPAPKHRVWYCWA